jgi:hypothetical protein
MEIRRIAEAVLKKSSLQALNTNAKNGFPAALMG